MKNISSVLLIMIVSLWISNCQIIDKQNNVLSFESVKIYKSFQSRGLSTAGAYVNFDDMEKESVPKIIVTDEDIIKFEQILKSAEKKKHYQTKFGGDLIFCEVKFLNQTISHRMVITDISTVYDIFGKVKEKRIIITDLTEGTNYKVKNSFDLEWLSNFSKKNKNI